MGETRIADSVHGTVTLDDQEAKVVSSRAFQRLRGVKHLGLASLVFPGADYSRLAHGIGTLHVTGLTLDALSKNVSGAVSEDERRLYRMAALLHDIGHYPFSHTFERALKNFYAAANVIQPIGSDASGTPELRSEVWLHEKMGRQILLHDSELKELLAEVGIDPEDLAGIIERVDPPKFANLVSSDLDADRTDYLMRTAKHTGLPYGNVDLPYLLSQIRVDSENQICFTDKGLRAAEHLLLSRYFDYQQVSFHKTVAGLELVLNDAVKVLLDHELLDCSSERLQTMVETGDWYVFDDAAIVGLMRGALQQGITERERSVLEAVLHRSPPKLVASRERLGGSEVSDGFISLRTIANSKQKEWEDEFGVPIYLWTQQGSSLTKIGSTVPVSALSLADEDSFDKYQQSVHILKEDGSSRPIQEHPRSLIRALSAQGVFSLRVYALLPPGEESKRERISLRVNMDLTTLWQES